MASPDYIYFASDFHLGVPDIQSSLHREKRIVKWLDETSENASAYYLLGDLFDFWFEYRHVVPKGYVRLLGKIAELSDRGIDIHIFTGNHDLWMNGYLKEALNATIHTKPLRISLSGKKFYLAHGDGLGPGDRGYKALKVLFNNKFAQRMFRLLHPDWGVPLASFFSGRSRMANLENAHEKIDPDCEMQVRFARNLLAQMQIDYFIFGHRHIPYEYALNDQARLINLGDWMRHFTYAVFNGRTLHLKSYNG